MTPIYCSFIRFKQYYNMHTLKFLLNTIQRTNKAQSLREKLVIKNTRKMFYLTRSSVLLVMSSPLLEHKLLAPGCE